MKKVWLDSGRTTAGPGLRIFGVVLAIVLLAGCKAMPPLPPAVQDFGPSYRPTNVYRRYATLPPQIRRVALLPLTMTSSTPEMQPGLDALEPLVYAELEKTKRFEVIPVSPQHLQQWTGQTGWRTDEALPPNLFERVNAATGCDAILFCQLSRYQPYQPLAVGWKFSLIEVPPPGTNTAEALKPRILWSVDEVLDAGDPVVATGARLYYNQHMRNDAASADASVMLNSPVRFGQYTLSTLLATLPERATEKR